MTDRYTLVVRIACVVGALIGLTLALRSERKADRLSAGKEYPPSL